MRICNDADDHNHILSKSATFGFLPSSRVESSPGQSIKDSRVLTPTSTFAADEQWEIKAKVKIYLIHYYQRAADNIQKIGGLI